MSHRTKKNEKQKRKATQKQRLALLDYGTTRERGRHSKPNAGPLHACPLGCTGILPDGTEVPLTPRSMQRHMRRRHPGKKV